MLAGAAAFPLVKTIIETFDGSQAFFRRVGQELPEPGPVRPRGGGRAGPGLGDRRRSGRTADGGAGRVRVRRRGGRVRGGQPRPRRGPGAPRGRGRVQPSRVYLVQALLGGFIGAAIGFYFDAAQVTGGRRQVPPLPGRGRQARAVRRLSAAEQVGLHRPGDVTGGVSLLFAEALAGVISGRSPPGCSRSTGRSWRPTSSKETAPIRALFTRDGLVQLDREHDRGPPLGPVDVADHQVVPPADGRADLVQPGRRDPHRAGDLPGRRR